MISILNYSDLRMELNLKSKSPVERALPTITIY